MKLCSKEHAHQWRVFVFLCCLSATPDFKNDFIITKATILDNLHHQHIVVAKAS
jgi:6-pyruvoyl-tetrahydropterin synthase